MGFGSHTGVDIWSTFSSISVLTGLVSGVTGTSSTRRVRTVSLGWLVLGPLMPWMQNFRFRRAEMGWRPVWKRGTKYSV